MPAFGAACLTDQSSLQNNKHICSLTNKFDMWKFHCLKWQTLQHNFHENKTYTDNVQSNLHSVFCRMGHHNVYWRIAVPRTRPVVTDGLAYSMSDCLSVCHDRETCKNRLTDQHAVWVVNSGGPRKQGCTLALPCEYDWTVHVRRRCGLFVKLLWRLVVFSFFSLFFLFLFSVQGGRLNWLASAFERM